MLVHCQAGISRSATICIAYLMHHKEIGLEEAFDFLKAKRAVISPNLNFMRQLTEYETELKKGSGVTLADRRGLTKSLSLNLDSLLGDGNISCHPPKLSETFGLFKQQAFVYDMPMPPTTTCSPTTPICHNSPLVVSPS